MLVRGEKLVQLPCAGYVVGIVKLGGRCCSEHFENCRAGGHGASAATGAATANRRACPSAWDAKVHLPALQGWQKGLEVARGRPEVGTGRGVAPAEVCAPSVPVKAFTNRTFQGGFEHIPLVRPDRLPCPDYVMCFGTSCPLALRTCNVSGSLGPEGDTAR